jgi:hypothetical protein
MSTESLDVYEKYWDDYLAWVGDGHPSTSEFLIFLDEKGLIPEDD